MSASSLLLALTLVSIASPLWCAPAQGQWIVAAEVGAGRFWGGSIQKTEEHRSFRPYRPTTFGLGFERRGRRLGVALRLGYASAGLALEGPDAVVAVKGVFGLYSAAPEIVYRLTSAGHRNQVLLHAGPLFELWSVKNERSQSRVGAQVAVGLSVPLSGRFAGSVTAGAALTPSPFAADQLDEHFERRVLWRRWTAAGLEYRW